MTARPADDPDDLRPLDDERRELWIRAIAPPAALALAAVLVAAPGPHALVRTFLSMWIHELGHAVTAWFCGLSAFPGPWFTSVSPDRRPFLVLLLAGALGTLGWRAWRAERWGVLAAAAAALLVQGICTLALPVHVAEELVTFGGDGGAMVLGAALVATLWSDPEGPLGRGALRWGFLFIGAAALVDALDAWVRARSDPDAAPLGRIEGVGLSDASKLLEVNGWSLPAISGRYVALGVACLAALAIAEVLVVRDARARVGAARRVALAAARRARDEAAQRARDEAAQRAAR